MKVLQVLGELRASGAEVMIRDAVPHFRALDIEPLIVSTGERVGAFAGAYAALGVRVAHVPFARGPGFATSFLRLLRRERPDAVHLHTERANAALGILARASGTRTVRTVHNVFFYSGRLRAVRTLERGALRALGVQHISIGRAVDENEKKRLGNPTVRVDNWIAARFRPPDAGERAAARRGFSIPDGHLVLASIGNCSPVKNHAAILAALPSVARRMDRPVVYLHAGSGVDEAAEKVAARSLPPSVDVRFLGAVGDVMPVLWAADVFCMPSLYEGVGIAALEAMACAVPSVLGDVEGLRDVHPSSSAVHFVAPTPQGVASGISHVVAADSTDVERAGREGSRQVRAQRAVRPQVMRLARLYRGG